MLHRPIAPEASGRFAPPVFVIAGAVFAVIGGGLGAFSGMMLPVPFDYGGLSGYESGMGFGSVVGMGLATLLCVRLWVRDRVFRRRLYAVLLCAWPVSVVLGHVLPQMEWTNPFMVWLFPITVIALAGNRVRHASHERFMRIVAYGGVAAAGLCALLLYFALSLHASARIPVAPERGGFTLGSVTLTDTTLSVTVSRLPAEATLLVWKTRAVPTWLRRIGLDVRYDAEVNVLNRFGAPLFFGQASQFLPPEALRVVEHAPLTNEQQREDIRLAMDALSLLYYDTPDVRASFGTNLETLYEELRQTKLSIGTAP